MSEPDDPHWQEVLELLQAGRDRVAYNRIRARWPFPEMAARLRADLVQPIDASGTTLREVVCHLSERARASAWTALSLQAIGAAGHVGAVGAGPAGLSATAALLECGHSVTLYERSDQLGGMPQLVIRAVRCPDVEPEVYAVLQPAIEAGRLQLRFGHELGRNLGLKILQASHDAVLLTVGLWEETSLGERVPGLVDGLTFLGDLKSGLRTSVPDQVVILGGGDSAMDVSAAVYALGAREVRFVYAGPFSDMHWHLRDDWFETYGVKLLDRTKPLGVALDDAGAVEGLRTEGAGVLEAKLVIEAMGGHVAAAVGKELGQQNGDGIHSVLRRQDEAVFAAGALANGGASVSRCMAEGLQTAAEIDRFLA